MLNTPTLPPKQVLLRLPEDIAARLARAIPARQRNRYIVDLLARDLRDKEQAERQMLIDAAEHLNRIEAADPALVQESREWLDAPLIESDEDDFDHAKFEKEFAEAQARRRTRRAADSRP